MLGSLFLADSLQPVTGVRALALLWVLLFHGVSTLSKTLAGGGFAVAPWQLAWWQVAFAMNGDIGVDIFLVISGYLLSGMLSRELELSSRVHFRAFYARRWFRITP